MNLNNHLRGSASGFIYQIISITVGLMLTPFILSTLGNQLFGVWALLNMIVAYESISDLGIPAAMIVFINKSQSNEQKNRLITAGVLANTALTLLVIVLLIFLRDPIISLLFKIPDDFVPATGQAYNLMLVTLFLLVLTRSFSAVLDAFQHVDARFAVDTLGMLVWAGVTWVLLARGLGLAGIIGATLLVSVLRAFMMGVSVRRFYPHFRVRLGLTKSVLSEIFNYGFKVQGASLGLSLSNSLLKSLTAFGLTPTHVGALQVGSSVAAVPNSISHSMIANLFPAISKCHGEGDTVSASRLVALYMLFIAALLFPITAFFLFAAPTLVQVWLRDTQPLIVTSVRLLAFAFLFRALAMVPWRVSWGLGRPQDSSVAMIIHISILAGFGGLLLLGSSFSFTGILVVYICSFVASTLYLYIRMHNKLPVFFSQDNLWLLWSILRILLITSVGAILYYLVSQLNLSRNIYLLLIYSLILGFSYLIVLLLAVPKSERQSLIQIFQTLIQKTKVFLHTRKEQTSSKPLSSD